MDQGDNPLLIYLDTSDYSRFALALTAGGEDAEIYNCLLAAKRSGKVKFAYSMTILSELLQYDDEHVDQTRARARIVEDLCERNCFIFPLRLIMLEVAIYINPLFGRASPIINPLSEDSLWFPDLEFELGDLKAKMHQRIDREVAELGPLNRAKRRSVQSTVRRFNAAKMVSAAAPQMAEIYGISERDVKASLGAVLEDRISPAEGAQRLFSAFGRPTTFVQAFFVAGGGDHKMPAWVSAFGRTLQEILMDARARFNDLPQNFAPPRDTIRKMIHDMSVRATETLVEKSAEICEEFDVIPETAVKALPLMQVNGISPAINTFRDVFSLFLSAHLGFEGGGYKPERSSWGDMMHVINLPYVDLWRGDRRFSNIVRQAVPQYQDQVVSRLVDLPKIINSLRPNIR